MLLALLYYLPALLAKEPEVNPQLNNLPAIFLKGSAPAGIPAEDKKFYQDLEQARVLVRDFELPLWSSENGGRPLLAESPAPLLYPPAFLYYLPGPGGLIFFAIFHFWIAGIGLYLLGKRLWPHGQWFLAIFLVLVPLGYLRADWLAGLALVPVGMWLLARKGLVGLLLFTFIAGLILLVLPFAPALLIISSIAGWGLAFEIKAAPRGYFQIFKLAGLLALAFLISLGLAAPQLFPRLAQTYGEKLPDYAPAPGAGLSARQGSGQPVLLEPLLRRGAADIELVLQVPPDSNPFQLELAQRYAPGWTASVTGGQVLPGNNLVKEEPVSAKSREIKVEPNSAGEQTVKIFPAPEGGQFRVRFRYNPLAFTLGLYAGLLGLASILMGFTILGWNRFYREDESQHPVRRIAKNSITPVFAQLFGKGLDFGFALFSLRLLGPDGNGRYTIAVTTWLLFSTITDFGLETIVTREVARDRSPEKANRYFITMLFTRLCFSTLSVPLALFYIGGYNLVGNLGGDTSLALLVLMFTFLPGSFSSSMSAIFRGFEKYEFLAAIQVLTAIIRVPLGLGALLAGWGVVGLAGSSLVVNFVTLFALTPLFRRELFRPSFSKKAFSLALARQMLVLSYPLMLNNLVNNIFFKSDALLLGVIRSETEVGLYNSAYKFIDAVLIIPSAFTLALFPIMASYGSGAREQLKRTYTEGMRLLLIIGLPISTGTLFVAHDLIGAVGGTRYLPGGAVALQILIWFLPFSYVNGLTQYVLIALNKQRLITFALIGTAATNIILNLIFIPHFGYVAASAMTIVAEVILMVPFLLISSRELGSLPLFKVSWRPLLSSGFMFGWLLVLVVGLGINNFFITVLTGGFFYLAGLILTGTLRSQDIQLFKRIFQGGR